MKVCKNKSSCSLLLILGALWTGWTPQVAVLAFPQGAGGCDGGVAAVGGSHLGGTAVNGTLNDGGFALQITNTAINPDVKLYIQPGKQSKKQNDQPV